MGYFDSNLDFEIEQQKRRKRAIEKLVRLERVLEELDTIMRLEFPTHGGQRHPFLQSWYDFQKEYIAWQYEEGLVIKDPNIIIDALKDDK